MLFSGNAVKKIQFLSPRFPVLFKKICLLFYIPKNASFHCFRNDSFSKTQIFYFVSLVSFERIFLAKMDFLISILNLDIWVWKNKTVSWKENGGKYSHGKKKKTEKK